MTETGLIVKLDSSLNTANPKDLPGVIQAMALLVNQSILKPGEIKHEELEFLQRNAAAREAILKGHLSKDRFQIWKDLKGLSTARQIGEVVAQRISLGDESQSKITKSETDTNIIYYLSDQGLSMFFEVSSLGSTEDTPPSLRRARILSMIQECEGKYTGIQGKLETESDWQDFYEKAYNFFDPEKVREGVRANVDWLRTYILYYSAVWSFTKIDFRNPAEGVDPSEPKFRGLMRFMNSLSKGNRQAILQKMEELDRSTKMKINIDGKEYLPTREIDRMRDNLYSYNNYAKSIEPKSSP